jgi:hypothetical protein
MADSAFFVSFSLNQVHLTTVAFQDCARQPAMLLPGCRHLPTFGQQLRAVELQPGS